MYPKFIKRLDTDEEPSAYVRDADEHAAQLIGWGLDPLMTGDKPVSSEVTKEDLQAECDLRGIEYDKRWGVAKLKELLA